MTAAPPLDAEQLERLLRAADPAVSLVAPRVLRRLIKRHTGAAGFGPLLPHAHSYTLDAATALRHADRADLHLPPAGPPPGTLILLERPAPEALAGPSPGEVLVGYWRRLFHARVHLVLAQRAAAGKLTDADVRQRIERIGQTEFDEVRTVLRQERALLPPADDRTAYVEFAAVYLELRHFAPERLTHYFPALLDRARVEALLAEDVDAGALFSATRPPAAPDPESVAGTHHDAEPLAQAAPPPPPEAAEALRAEARAVEAQGNVARAASLRVRAAGAVVGTELDRLVERLQRALGLTDEQSAALRRALPPLLARAALGGWTVEARLLYDLQKACVDEERGIVQVQLVRWAVSLGRRPLKRPMPNERRVLVFRHVRSAAARVDRVHLPAADRENLAAALGDVVEHTAAHLRDHFRPLLAGAFDRVGLEPANLPERVARDKLVEELLDHIVAKGFLTLGDLRDGIARNQLKLGDLSGPREWVTGDRLLKLNAQLAEVLEGVYRKGEVYLRGLQRLSSLAFGTRPGRLLTRFIALPFGGAFVALAGVQFLLEEVGIHVHLIEDPWTVGALGVFFFLLLHVPAFRRQVRAGLVVVGRAARATFLNAPAWLLGRPWVRAVLASAPARLLARHLLLPSIVAGVGAAVARLSGAGPPTVGTVAGSLFVAAWAVFNSQLGAELVELAGDRLATGWERLRRDFVPALFRAIMAFFKAMLEYVERVLYAVDERLRFRSGDSSLSLALKAIAGSVWAVFAYVVRFALVLLVEPQVNPLKHFPTVTVAHKLLLPLIPQLAALLNPDDPLAAAPQATLIITAIPGIFGFLVWELKENWKLYRANRAPTLCPVLVGSHGETVPRLLRPGFHSGTVPKLYAKLRKAERRGKDAAAHRYQEGLHHVEEDVRHFVERELLRLLSLSRGWGGLRVELRAVGLASNRIRLDLACPELAEEAFEVVLDHRVGWLVASVSRAGWLRQLTAEQRGALTLGLAGLYKRAGVDLTREQIEAAFAPTPVGYTFSRAGLVVWLAGAYERAAVYEVTDGETVRPRGAEGAAIELPVMRRNQLSFRDVPITWSAWVEAWERDQAGEPQTAPVVEERKLVPAVTQA